jgi:hypothetical protein
MDLSIRDPACDKSADRLGVFGPKADVRVACAPTRAVAKRHARALYRPADHADHNRGKFRLGTES